MARLKKLKIKGNDLIAIALVIIYLYSLIILQRDTPNNQQSNILSLKLSSTIVKGVITQIQMLISVVIVLLGAKKHYSVAFIINLLGLMGSIRFAVINKSNASVPGILSYTGVILIITLIYLYKSKLRNKISELELKEKELRKLAYFDGLTDILNRKTFIDELDLHIEFFEDQKRKMYVIFIDVDDFKNINDTYGHFTGDIVLKELAQRIKTGIHEEDIVGRLGGDEIGIIITRNIEPVSAKHYINALRESILRPYIIDKKEFFVTVSMGVSEFPHNGNSSLELLKNADIAMYNAKFNGKNRINYFSE